MTTIRQIIEATAAHYEITPDDLRGPSRERVFAMPRQLAMWIAREHFNFSLTDIGNAFHREHTTVMHAVRAVSGRQVDREAVQAITENALGGMFRSVRAVPFFETRRAA